MAKVDLPKPHGILAERDGRTSRQFYDWFRRIQDQIDAGELTPNEALPLIAEMATKLGSPDGTVGNIPENVIRAGEGITVYPNGDLRQNDVFIALDPTLEDEAPPLPLGAFLTLGDAVEGEPGLQGPPGPQGPPGRDGATLLLDFDPGEPLMTPPANLSEVIGSYRTLLQAASIITAGSIAGTYALVANGDGCVLSGDSTATPIQTIYVDSADYPPINGTSTKLRIRVQLYTNDTAPTGNYTFGLYPVTRPATSGGSGVNVYDLGTVVTGSDGATFTAPAADGLLNAVGADFALPANGHYVIGVVTTAPPAANSNIQITAYLQMHNA